MDVLSQITKRLLSAGGTDSLHEFMAASMLQAARGADVPYAGLVSDVLQPRGERALGIHPSEEGVLQCLAC